VRVLTYVHREMKLGVQLTFCEISFFLAGPSSGPRKTAFSIDRVLIRTHYVRSIAARAHATLHIVVFVVVAPQIILTVKLGIDNTISDVTYLY
jgi:hypothetical protein